MRSFSIICGYRDRHLSINCRQKQGSRTWAHLVELPQVLFLRLVDDSQNPGDGLPNNPAMRVGKEKVGGCQMLFVENACQSAFKSKVPLYALYRL